METNPDTAIDVDEAMITSDTIQLEDQPANDATSERPVSDNPSESAQETLDRNLIVKDQVVVNFFSCRCL